MNTMNRRLMLGVLAVSTLFLVSGFSGMAGTGVELETVDLLAGQDMKVGTVEVSDDATNIYVMFTVTEDGWYLTETHVDIQVNTANFPLTKKGNPQIGHFAYSDDHGMTDEYEYTIPKSAITGLTEDFYVAAHAVVVEVQEAPYYGASVYDYSQGLRKDGTPVLAARSIPSQGLVYESGQSESNFFSLGFGGYMTVVFDCPVMNGDGVDVKVWEDTWGSYPLEKAAVYASQDGTTWTYLGEADNTNNAGIHTVSEFDLGSLAWAKYIKVVDTSDPAVHNNAADGYDLNAVEALQDCIISEETAWGDGTGFPGNSWAMYFFVDA